MGISSWLLQFQSNSLFMAWESRGGWPKSVDLCIYMGDPEGSPGSWPSLWLSSDHCGHVVSELTDGRSLPLSPLCIAALVLGCVSLLYKEFSNITHLRLYLKFLSFRGNLSFIILLQSFVYFVSIFLSLCFSDLAN